MQSVRFSGVSSESETETDSGEEIGIFTKRCDDNKASSSKGVDVGVHSHNLSTNQSPGELADSSTAPNNVNQNINSVGCPAPNIFQDNLEQIVGMELTTALSIMPSFSGNFATLSSFIDDIDGINDLLDVALRPVFFTAIKAKLSEDVRQKIAGANFNDWNTLRPVLRQRIRPKYSEIDARNRLRECKQKPGKTISEFADRVRSHLYDLNLHDAENVRFKSMNEDEAKRTFAKGLLDNNLRSHAMWVMADDLEKLINYAHEHNPAMNEPGPSLPFQSAKATFPIRIATIAAMLAAGQTKEAITIATVIAKITHREVISMHVMIAVVMGMHVWQTAKAIIRTIIKIKTKLIFQISHHTKCQMLYSRIRQIMALMRDAVQIARTKMFMVALDSRVVLLVDYLVVVQILILLYRTLRSKATEPTNRKTEWGEI